MFILTRTIKKMKINPLAYYNHDLKKKVEMLRVLKKRKRIVCDTEAKQMVKLISNFVSFANKKVTNLRIIYIIL